MKRPLIITLFIGIAFIIYFLYRYAMDSPYRISSGEAKKRLSKKDIDLVLDVRTPTERAVLGSYPNSVAIPSTELETQMPAAYLDRNIRILIYCNTGQRARKATDILHRLGYKNTVYITGSYRSLY